MRAAAGFKCASSQVRKTFTFAPIFCKYREAASASPPLLPLPTSTQIDLSRTPCSREAIACAVRWPALSISSNSGRPYTSAAALSILRISSLKAIFISLPPLHIVLPHILWCESKTARPCPHFFPWPLLPKSPAN